MEKEKIIEGFKQQIADFGLTEEHWKRFISTQKESLGPRVLFYADGAWWKTYAYDAKLHFYRFNSDDQEEIILKYDDIWGKGR